MGRGLLLWLIGIPLPDHLIDLAVRRFALDRDQPKSCFSSSKVGSMAFGIRRN
jgi:hypothetical protein